MNLSKRSFTYEIKQIDLGTSFGGSHADNGCAAFTGGICRNGSSRGGSRAEH